MLEIHHLQDKDEPTLDVPVSAMPTITKDGYKRIKTRGPLRDFLEHRVVAMEAWGPRLPFPDNMEVHHMDHNRQHNCRENLIIIQDCLHHLDARTAYRRGKRKVLRYYCPGQAEPSDSAVEREAKRNGKKRMDNPSKAF